jgi:hypothetical protein
VAGGKPGRRGSGERHLGLAHDDHGAWHADAGYRRGARGGLAGRGHLAGKGRAVREAQYRTLAERATAAQETTAVELTQLRARLDEVEAILKQVD